MQWKKMLGIVMLLHVVYVQGDWTLGTIYNNSDLIIDAAWQYGVSGKVRPLASLTSLMQHSYEHKRSTAVLNYKISKRGLAFRGRDNKGHQVDIFLDGQATHSVLWNRKKTKNITDFASDASIENGPWCARAIMRDVADGKVLSNSVVLGHDDQDQVCDLTISGVGGKYTLALEMVA